MKNNELHSMLEKMVDDIDAKMKLLELEDADENNEKMLFEYDVKDLEKGFLNLEKYVKIVANNVVIKTSRPGTMSRKYFLNEMIMLKKLHHENLIQLFAVCTFEKPIYFVTEYMAKGALLEFLQKGDGLKLKEQELIDVGAQVAAGMAHLEMHNYIHRNLAARNVLVGENNNIKIADFKMARVVEEDIYKAKAGAKFS